jgi:hypothetical protein
MIQESLSGGMKMTMASEIRLKSWRSLWVTAGFFLFSSVGEIHALSVSLDVQETAGVARNQEPVTSGIPIPRGENLTSTNGLGIDGGAVPAEFRVLARWDGAPDDLSKPIKWLLVDFQATVAPNMVTRHTLGSGPGNAGGPDLASLSGDGNTITVNTGVLKFTVKKSGFNIIDEAWLDTSGVFGAATKIISSNPGTGGFIQEQSGTSYSTYQSQPSNGAVTFRSSFSDRPYTRPDLGFVIEENGPLRTVIKVKARHRNGGADSMGFETRIFAYKGKSYVKIDHAYFNGMCAGSFQGSFTNFADDVAYKAIGLNFRLDLSGEKNVLVGKEGRSYLSGTLGGGQIVSMNANDADTGGALTYTLNNQGSASAMSGRAEGWADLSDAQRGMTIIDRWFWQKYEKGLTLSDDGGVRIDLSKNDKVWEAQGLSDLVTLYFHGSGVSAEELVPVIFGFVKNPLFAMASSEWYRQSGAFLPLSPYSSNRPPACGTDLACWMEGDLEGNFSKAMENRESNLIYGGLNFGGLLDQDDDLTGSSHDLSGDHGVNYYDGIYIMAHNLVRKADVESGPSKSLEWLRLLTESARHTMETEAYHVFPGLGYREDINGLMPAYGQAYRSGVHIEHNFGSGLFYYHYLTGDERARQRALDGAVSLYVNKWMDAPGISEPGALMDPGRLTGQTQDWFAHAYELTGDPLFKARLESAINLTIQEFNRRLDPAKSTTKLRATGMRQVIGLQLPAIYRAWVATGRSHEDWVSAVAAVSDFNMKEDRNPSTGLIEAEGYFGNFLGYDGYPNEQCGVSWFLNGALNDKNAADNNGHFTCYPATQLELMGGMWVAYAMTGNAKYVNFLKANDFYVNRLRDESAGGSPGFGRPAQSLRNSMHLNAMMVMDILDDQAPVLSGVRAGGISSIGAQVSWSTDEPADAQVEYGVGTAYGMTSPLADVSPRASDHAVDLSQLAGSTTYHFRVRSKDAAGNLALSPSLTFTTLPPDITPPTAPRNLAAAAFSDSGITVSWDPSSDLETGIAGYHVSRDGGEIGITTMTSFLDAGLEEASPHVYVVKAVNGQGLEKAASPVSATTLPDRTPPFLMSAGPLDPSHLRVEFNEAMDVSSTENIANYSINGGIVVLGAALSTDGRTVSLTTGLHEEAKGYILTVRNLRDRSSSPNGLPLSEAGYKFTIDVVLQEGLVVPELGLGSYLGTEDAGLKGDERDLNQADLSVVQVFEMLGRRPLFRFALPDLSGYVVVSAKLALYSVRDDFADVSGMLVLYPLSRSWVENQVTYNSFAMGSPWSNPGGDWNTTRDFGTGTPGAAARASIAPDAWVEFDVTQLAQMWGDGGLLNQGVIVRGANAKFYSSENTDLSRRPRLIFELAKKTGGAVSQVPLRPRRLKARAF